MYVALFVPELSGGVLHVPSSRVWGRCEGRHVYWIAILGYDSFKSIFNDMFSSRTESDTVREGEVEPRNQLYGDTSPRSMYATTRGELGTIEMATHFMALPSTGGTKNDIWKRQ